MSHYRINVSLDGKHLFATEEGSITYEPQLKKIVKIFGEKFPESEGYEISLTHWKTTGNDIDFYEVLSEYKDEETIL